MAYLEHESPADVGRHWAEEKAERLRGHISAPDWPPLWERSFDGKLELPEEVPESEGRAYHEAAHYAAAARWLELVEEQREAEGQTHDEESYEELAAIKLLESVRGVLPTQLTAEREGARVFVEDGRGFEMTVRSVEDAWRAASDWDERFTR